MIRVFLAVEPSRALRARLVAVQDELRPGLDSLRWVRPEALHLTLCFLGATGEDRIGALHTAIVPVARGFPARSFEVRGLGVFPDPQQPAVLWAGVEDPRGALAECAAGLRAALAPLGFVSDPRPLRPHLTLARVPRDARAIATKLREAGLPDEMRSFGSLAMEKVVLLESRPDRAGRGYHRLAGFDCEGERADEV